MKSIFLVKTPLQLLNAIEARLHFNVAISDSVLILMADRKSQAQLYQLANVENHWGEVIDLNVAPVFGVKNAKNWIKKIQQFKVFRKSFFYVIKLNRIAEHVGEARFVFVGHAKYLYMKHFSNTLMHKETVTLDDGNATIQIAKERRENISLRSTIRNKAKIKLTLKRALQGLKDEDYKKLTYFTIYDINCGSDDEVINNSYVNIRKKMNRLEVCEKVYFVGSPISETGILAHSKYMQHLKRVKSYFNDKELVYVSHRRESSANLTEIENSIGIKVVSFEFPLEYQLAIIGPRPKVLASFISSALDSCKLIFAEQLDIVSFKINLEDSPYRKEIESIYKNYRLSSSDNFTVEENY